MLNILKNYQSHFCPGSKFCTEDKLGFEGFEETFCYRVIPTITFSAHTLFNLQRFQYVYGLSASILNTPVRVKNHSFRKGSVSVSHTDGRDNSVRRFHILAHGPAYRFAVEKIQNHRQVKEAVHARDVGQIRYTGLGRLITPESTVQQVGCHLIVMIGVGSHLEALREPAAHSHLSHMATDCETRYLSSAHLKVYSQSGTAIAPFGGKVGLFNLLVKFHIFTFSFANGINKPPVIGAAGHSQYFAHQLDRPSYRVVVLDKPIDQRPLLEVMPKAFFRMSHSVSASKRRFSNSEIRLASSLRACTPLPGKLKGPLFWNSLRQRYSIKGSIPNSCTSSDTFLRSKLNLTAFSLNALS